jgi:hypothetical protein
MKKFFICGLLVLTSLIMVTFRQEKVYGISFNEGKDEIVSLTQSEIEFFDKMKIKKQYELEGVLVVDSINGSEKETIDIDGVKYEYDAIVYNIFEASMSGEMVAKIDASTDGIDSSFVSELLLIQEKANQEMLKYDDILELVDNKDFVEKNKGFIKNMFSSGVIIDSREYSLMAT